MHDPTWLASHTQYGGVQNDPPKIRIGVQVLNMATVGVNELIVIIHCVQKKTPTHIFFHISMSDV